MGNDNNKLPDLVEILLRIAAGNEPDSHEVRVELRIGSITLSLDEETEIEFEVKLERASLEMDLDGLTIEPRTRFGEPALENTVKVKREHASESARSGEASAKVDASISTGASPTASAGFSASGKVANSTSEKRTSEDVLEYVRVKARGNMVWEISEPPITGKGFLSDTYLNDEVLCRVKAMPGANALAVRLAAWARKRDIKIAPSKSNFTVFKTRNHEKLFQALIAKSLRHSTANGGFVQFSISEAYVEENR